MEADQENKSAFVALYGIDEEDLDPEDAAVIQDVMHTELAKRGHTDLTNVSIATGNRAEKMREVDEEVHQEQINQLS